VRHCCACGYETNYVVRRYAADVPICERCYEVLPEEYVDKLCKARYNAKVLNNWRDMYVCE